MTRIKVLNKAYFFLFLALIFLVVGIIQFFRWFNNYDVSILGYSILMWPSIVLFGSYFLSNIINRHSVNIFLVLACVVSIVIFGFTNVVIETWEIGNTEITELDKYNLIIENINRSEPDLVGHFPINIPPNAENVRFSFRPPFLQGGAHIQLRYKTSTEQIKNLYTMFSDKKIISISGGDANGYKNPEGGIRTSFFSTSDSPDDYEIMVLSAQSCDPEECGFKGNHGKSAGVAISVAQSDIIYWAELW